MKPIKKYLEEFTSKLKQTFQDDLIFVGLQGSYQRGEATNTSDIDIVVILNEVTMKELREYRNLIEQEKERDKLCGFISGKKEILNWPKMELFQLMMDTRPYYGTLNNLIDTDIKSIYQSVHFGGSSIYHGACHSYLHDKKEEAMKVLAQLYKQAFFILQLKYYLKSTTYIGKQKELLGLLKGIDKDILVKRMRQNYEYESDFEQIIKWSSTIINNYNC